jgi:adenine-specific DNA-methyltransferase
VLGAIESGVDFEKRINDIYQTCRRPEEIEAAFLQLRLELDAEISEQMTRTRQQLLEHFDDEVREKLRMQQEASRAALDRHERTLMALTRHELDSVAEFLDESSFVLLSAPFELDVPAGRYELPRRSEDAHVYRLTHPLAEAVIARAKARDLPSATIRFSLSEHAGRISALEPMKGHGGELAVSLLTIDALDDREEHLILAATCDGGGSLDDDVVKRLIELPARLDGSHPGAPGEQVDAITERRRLAITQDAANRNLAYFAAESDKLDAWADDLKAGLEREIKEIDRDIREARKSAKLALTLEEKLAAQREIKALELRRNQKRRTLFDAHDQIDARREELIAAIEGKLAQHESLTRLFTICWRLA